MTLGERILLDQLAAAEAKIRHEAERAEGDKRRVLRNEIPKLRMLRERLEKALA